MVKVHDGGGAPPGGPPPHVYWRKERASYRLWRVFSRLVGRRAAVAAVVHVYWDAKLFERAVRLYDGADVLAVGGAVPYLKIVRGARGGRQTVVRCVAAAKELHGGWVHLLGAGRPRFIAEAAPHSADSAAWRKLAAHGKVLLPNGEERDVARKKLRAIIARPASEEELKWLYSYVGFPLCWEEFRQRLGDHKFRALVNAAVLSKIALKS
ncbi:MAG: hypothetical protein QW247_10710 [Pyrobaculum sp.]